MLFEINLHTSRSLNWLLVVDHVVFKVKVRHANVDLADVVNLAWIEPETGLFVHFAHDRLNDWLSMVQLASRYPPVVSFSLCILAMQEQDLILVVKEAAADNGSSGMKVSRLFKVDPRLQCTAENQ